LILSNSTHLIIIYVSVYQEQQLVICVNNQLIFFNILFYITRFQ